MHRYRQSDDAAADDSFVSSPASQHASHDEDESTNQQDHCAPEKDTGAFAGPTPSGRKFHLKLSTLLNGPQWRLANPASRRATRVDYRLTKPPTERKRTQSPRVSSSQAHQTAPDLVIFCTA